MSHTCRIQDNIKALFASMDLLFKRKEVRGYQ